MWKCYCAYEIPTVFPTYNNMLIMSVNVPYDNTGMWEVVVGILHELHQTSHIYLLL